MMNLALIIQRFDPAGGGAERSLAQIADHLVRRGHQVTVICGWHNHRPDSIQFPVLTRFKNRPHTALSALELARWARRAAFGGSYDASLSVTTAMPASVLQPRSGTIAESLARNVALRSSATARLLKRCLIGLSPKMQALLHLERRTLADPRVEHIVAISRYVSEQLHRRYRINAERMTCLPNAAQMPALSASDRMLKRQRVRQCFRVPPDAVVYLFAAHNPRLKGAETLLGAFGQVQRDGHERVLLLAGRISYAQQRTAAMLGIRDQVRFIGTTERMSDLYAASDVTVLPTYYDPSSKVVIESLMMGVPAITTIYNGAADLVIGPGHAPRGRVIQDPSDAAELAGAMGQLADPEERRRCAAATGGLDQTLSMCRHVDHLETILARVAGCHEAVAR